MNARVAAAVVLMICLARVYGSGAVNAYEIEPAPGAVAAAHPESGHEPSPRLPASPSAEASPVVEASPSAEPSPTVGASPSEGAQPAFVSVSIRKSIDLDGDLETPYGFAGGDWPFEVDVTDGEITSGSSTTDPDGWTALDLVTDGTATVTVTEINDGNHRLIHASCYGSLSSGTSGDVGTWEGTSVTFVALPYGHYECDFVNYPLQAPGGDVFVIKHVDLDGDLRTSEDRVLAGGWTFQIGARDAEVTATSVTTDEDLFDSAEFEYATRQEGAAVTVTENSRAGYELMDVRCMEESSHNSTEVGELVGRSVTFRVVPPWSYHCHFVSTAAPVSPTDGVSPTPTVDVVGVGATARPSIALPQTDSTERLADRRSERGSSPRIVLVSLGLLCMAVLLATVRTKRARL